MGIQILDAVTLKQLRVFVPPQDRTQLLSFSPEGHFLIWLGEESKVFISWDLQTGVQVGRISMGGSNLDSLSIAHSECGQMLGVLLKDKGTITISTYDILSEKPLHHHQIKEPAIGRIWTCGKCLQFATSSPGSITIWEVGFNSEHPPIIVKSLPTPNSFNPSRHFIFLPTHSRLAFIFEGAIIVWDAQNSKILLNSTDVGVLEDMTFSSDGDFFVCGNLDICLWKYSTAGYILHQKLVSSGVSFHGPLLSPNGQSIISASGSTLQLWYTTDSTTSSSIPVQTFQQTRHFIVEFSPDRSLAVAAWLADTVATIFNLKSGALELTIDTGMEICGLGIAGSTIIVVCGGKIITWNLSAGNHASGTRVDISNSVQTTILNPLVPSIPVSSSLPLVSSASISSDLSPVSPTSVSSNLPLVPSASISPNSNHIAILEVQGRDGCLKIYDMPTGKHLIGIHLDSLRSTATLWFTPGGHEVWICNEEIKGWTIVKDSKSDAINLEHLNTTGKPSGGFPWESSRGYQVTDDGWILSPSKEQLLWLPHHWRPGEVYRVWSEQFLVLLHHELPEVVILELLKK